MWLSLGIFLAALTAGYAQQTYKCQCALYTDVYGSVQERIPYATGPLWLLDNTDSPDVPCDGYLESACYLFCDRVTRDWLNTTRLGDEVDIQGQPEGTTYGDYFCKRSLQLFEGVGYRGVTNETLQLAVRLDVPTCDNWRVKASYPDAEQRLCCTQGANYYDCGEGAPLE